MKRHKNYKTKQRETILNYIISLEGTHTTVAQIVDHFERTEVSVGRTTIYRHLDKMTERGELRRYTTDGISGACYQYVGNGNDHQAHLHLKCEGCGELQHLECRALNEIQQHFFDKHSFEVNALKTVLYGKCGKCLQKA